MSSNAPSPASPRRKPQVISGASSPATGSGSIATTLAQAILLAGGAAALTFMAVPEARHWFLIPVFACAVPLLDRLAKCARGQTIQSLPTVLFCVLGLYLFVATPIMHVAADYWMAIVQPPAEWREWLGLMASMNFVGLLLAFSLRAWILKRPTRPSDALAIEYTKARVAICVAVVAGLVAQAVVILRFDGWFNYVRSAMDRSESNLDGMGGILLVAEAVPILLVIAYVMHAKHHNRRPVAAELLLVVLAMIALQLFFGGLRGSRGLIVFPVAIALVLISVQLRRISLRVVILSALCFMVFMYGYGLYKGTGMDFAEVASRESPIHALEMESGRSLEGVIFGDLGRADVQAYLLYRVSDSSWGYQFGFGSSYVSAAMLPVPSEFRPDGMRDKVALGTDAQYGRGTYDSGAHRSTRLYGAAGEAMLNFSPIGAPLAIGIVGLLLGLLERWRRGFVPGDARYYVWSMLTILVALRVPVYDSGNVVVFALKFIALPFLVLIISSTRQRDL